MSRQVLFMIEKIGSNIGSCKYSIACSFSFHAIKHMQQWLKEVVLPRTIQS